MRRLIAAVILIVLGLSASAYADDRPAPTLAEPSTTAASTHIDENGIPIEPVSDAPCVDGLSAGTFPCEGIDLLSFVPQDEFGGSDPEVDLLGGGISDLWGWVDPETDDEYVIMGKTNGVAFFNVTDPKNPVFLGQMENKSPGELIWFDIKVYADHAFIVSESVAFGMDVFDLTRLRGLTEAPAETWTADTTYLSSALSAHNIAINEETGFAYLVGGNNGIVGPDQCRSGLHMVDIKDPTSPTFAGCHAAGEGPGPGAAASYIHDTQCVVYRGPDQDYTGRELCFNSSEVHMSIVDVTDKDAPVQIAKVEYPDTGYAHQGWLTEDWSHFMMGDEGDETGGQAERTRTIVFDVTDLDNASYVGTNEGATPAIDHNMYVKDRLVYQSNYAAGLRVLDTTGVASATLPEIAYFDGYPANDDPEFVGTWSNYPYFPSGTIAFSGSDEGLFLVKLQEGVAAPAAVRDLNRACPPEQVPANSHTDDDTNTHERAIECMVWWEIALGQTAERYAPGVAVSREQMASFVARLIEKAGAELPADAPSAFSDDDASHHRANIDKLAAAGLVDGKGDGRFAPRETVNRAQMAKFIVNAYEYVSGNTLSRGADGFSDDNGHLLEEFIDKSYESGFTAGRDGRYEPAQPVLRDQMASFLARTLDLLVAEGVTPPKAAA